ncbi:hypothetical protein D9756_008184 [Leucocoprinus leucothites]|uniref:Protein kinase domain-containing protein n=1 Tax=Leucocoprinus leucothites TaxID=201217 RepID=A0A8H5FWE3_9AGAR|nr:hypothetical protein D9756_008184 [Leucoagaricus leucothites]
MERFQKAFGTPSNISLSPTAMSNGQPRIQIVPQTKGGFILGLPGIPSNDAFPRGARIEGEVQISLPLLGAPASIVEVELQKAENITIDGQETISATDLLRRTVLWPPNVRRPETIDIYSRNFPFSIIIPEHVPPSVSRGNHGIEIEYSLRATVHRGNRSKFWSDKPLSCSVPIRITKYEQHPAWPIYHQPELKQMYHGSIRFSARPLRTCYSPGETIMLTTELSVGSYSVIPRSVEFAVKLQQLIATFKSSEKNAQSSHGQQGKKTTIDLISKQATTCAKMDRSTTFTAELACQIPGRDVKPSLPYSISHIQVSYVLTVTTTIHSQHLQLDVPIIVSPFYCRSSKAELEEIGSVPSLGGAPQFDYVSPKLEHVDTHRLSGTTISPDRTSTDYKFTFIDADDDPDPIFRARARRSGSIRTIDYDFFRQESPTGKTDIHLEEFNNEILKHWFTDPEESSISNPIDIRTSDATNFPSVNYAGLLGDLTYILQSPRKKATLLDLRKDRAQAAVDFLDSVLLALDPSKTRLRKQVLITLYRLCKESHCYPECYTIHNIEIESHEGGGGFCDIHRGHHKDQILCLKVVRQFRKTDTEAMIKLFAKEAILWSQLSHPNILPFYGIYYLGEEKRMCLVSPWMTNGNLVNYLQDHPLAPRRPFICDVVTGLEYLHESNIIHGDLKGVNVLVTSSGRACITDFGLSSVLVDKSITEAAMTTTVYGGTYRWIAPELLEDNDPQPTRESDIWAFGCVCYQILTRLVPFHEISLDIAVIRKIQNGRIPTQHPSGDARSTIDVIDDETWSLMKRCWSFDPGDRPTCRQIMEILGIIASASHYDITSYSLIAEFRSAMRNKDHAPIDLAKMSTIFDEIKQVDEEQQPGCEN